MKKLIKNRALAILLLCFIPLMNACAEKKMNLNVIVFNYWPRAIADVSINGQYAGGSYSAYRPGGAGASMVSGVPIHVGEQKIEWMLDGGENQPRLFEKITATVNLKDIPSNAKVLGIHIYPNETVYVETGVWHLEAHPNGAPK
jgi:hypothetical protein